MEPDNAILAQQIQDACVATVTLIFPDICPEYLEGIAAPLLYSAESVINHIVDSIEQGQPYERRQSRKRKRPAEGGDQSAATIRDDQPEDFDDDLIELLECQCCYTQTPINRVVHCQNETPHWFCIDCARQYSEHQVGMNKYEIKCFATDECTAPFALAQRSRFLDEKLQQALDRLEQDTVLRLANLDDLANCPFCPYAAEYPPIENNREFHCENPECQIVSCRLCNKESHTPKTCQEVAAESGELKARLEVEEAMTEALVRKCNKCQTPFIKTEGCNKMTCTRPGCLNIQCYICSQSCDYNHFTTRKSGCQLWDKVEERHDKDTKRAEEAAIKKVLAEHPQIDPKLLQLKVSEKVGFDDERRRKADEERAAKRDARRQGRREPALGRVPAIPLQHRPVARLPDFREERMKKILQPAEAGLQPVPKELDPLGLYLGILTRPNVTGLPIHAPGRVEQQSNRGPEPTLQPGQRSKQPEGLLGFPPDSGRPKYQYPVWGRPLASQIPLPGAAVAQEVPLMVPKQPEGQNQDRTRPRSLLYDGIGFGNMFIPRGPNRQFIQQLNNIQQPTTNPTVPLRNANHQAAVTQVPDWRSLASGSLQRSSEGASMLPERRHANQHVVSQQTPGLQDHPSSNQASVLPDIPIQNAANGNFLAASQQHLGNGLGMGGRERQFGSRYGHLALNAPDQPQKQTNPDFNPQNYFRPR